MEFQSKIVVPELKELHAMGYTKNHKRVDVCVVGKWYPMGYFMGEKGLKRTLKEAKSRIALNTGTKEEDVTILEPTE